jgi:hypothetical protein
MPDQGSIETLSREIRWRYLDSLDSVRFSQNTIQKPEPIPIRMTHARLDIMKAILWGSGIRVPGNQLVDSVGFITIAAELIGAAGEIRRQGGSPFIPLQFALFSYGRPDEIRDSFSLASFLFAKENFQLSAWPGLQYSDRAEWAKSLKERKLIPEKHLKGFDGLADDLYAVLSHFCLEPELQIPANATSGIRIALVKAIAALSEQNLLTDEFFSHCDNTTLRTCADIVTILRNLSNIRTDEGREIVDDRSAMRDALVSNDQVYDGTSNLMAVSKVGVLRTIDGIYNISSAIGADAEQDSHSREDSGLVFRDEASGGETAGYVLESWARNYARDHYPEYPRGTLRSFDTSKISYSAPIEAFLPVDTKKVWENFFESQGSGRWTSSLVHYLGSVADLADAAYELASRATKEITNADRMHLDDLKKIYRSAKNRHDDLVVDLLEDSYGLEKGILRIRNDTGDELASGSTDDFSQDKDLSEFVASEISDDSIKNSLSG